MQMTNDLPGKFVFGVDFFLGIKYSFLRILPTRKISSFEIVALSVNLH
jgi:hypothetical protein